MALRMMRVPGLIGSINIWSYGAGSISLREIAKITSSRHETLERERYLCLRQEKECSAPAVLFLS
jgi:hypothetical protein